MTALVIDARALYGSGIGRTVREVSSRLIRRGAFRNIMLAGDPNELHPWLADQSLSTAASVLPLAGGRYSFMSQLSWVRTAARIPKGAVIWYAHWDAPIFSPRHPSVVTVHDLIHLRVPGYAGPVQRTIVRAAIRRVVRQAKVVTVVSEFTRSELASFEPSAAHKVRVVPGGVAAPFLGAPQSLDSGEHPPYLLVVANRKPHKNIETAVSLLAVLRQSDPSLKLVIIGEQFAHWERLVAHARALGVADAIEDHHDLSDIQLVALYQRAICLVLPSRYEGFGLPMLEAFACGTPVVASNVTALPEVAGDAALLCGPDDIQGMANAVTRLRTESTLRAELGRRGRARAALFTWDRTAQGMEQALLEASQG